MSLSIKEALFGDSQNIESIEELEMRQEEMEDQFTYMLQETQEETSRLEKKIKKLLEKGNPEEAKSLAIIISQVEQFQDLLHSNYGQVIQYLYTVRLGMYSSQIEEVVEDTLKTIESKEILGSEKQKELRKRVKKLRKSLEKKRQQIKTPKTNERAEQIIERVAAESENTPVLEEEIDAKEEVATE